MPRPRSMSPVSTGGSESMRRAGRKPLLIGLTPNEHQQIRTAAAFIGVSMGELLRRHGLRAAQKILAKI